MAAGVTDRPHGGDHFHQFALCPGPPAKIRGNGGGQRIGVVDNQALKRGQHRTAGLGRWHASGTRGGVLLTENAPHIGISHDHCPVMRLAAFSPIIAEGLGCRSWG
jgi:hypothetical protein